MKGYNNWAIIVFALFVMFLCPLLILQLHETADLLRDVEPSRALIVRFLAWILRFFTGGVWALSLLFIADTVPKFAGWGLETNSRERRRINSILMCVGGYALCDVLIEIYKWFL